VNQAPVAVNDAYTIQEDQRLVVRLLAFWETIPTLITRDYGVFGQYDSNGCSN